MNYELYTKGPWTRFVTSLLIQKYFKLIITKYFLVHVDLKIYFLTFSIRQYVFFCGCRSVILG